MYTQDIERSLKMIYFYIPALDHALVMDGSTTVVVVRPPTCRSESGEENGWSSILGR